MTRCPECESDLDLDGYELDQGETINCPECSSSCGSSERPRGGHHIGD